MVDDLGNHKLFSGGLNFGMDAGCLLLLRDMIAVWEVFDNVYFGFLLKKLQQLGIRCNS